MTLGALVGGPVAGLISDNFGRQTALVLIGLPSALGWLSLTVSGWFTTGAFANFFALLLVGRIVSGFASGWASLVVPVSSSLSLSLSLSLSHSLSLSPLPIIFSQPLKIAVSRVPAGSVYKMTHCLWKGLGLGVV